MSATPDRFTPPTRVELLVIGGGTAGLVAAKTAARFGSRVLLVERERLGGDCLWAGCVPSKSLIAAAHAATAHRQAGALGVTAPTPAVDIAAVMEHVHGAIRAIEPTDSVDSVEETGARVLRGDVRFTSPTTAEVDGAPVRFAQAIIATGSSPAIPDLPGLDAVDPLTSDTVWELRTLPERLVVLCKARVGRARGRSGLSGRRQDVRPQPRQRVDVRAADQHLEVQVRRGGGAAVAGLRDGLANLDGLTGNDRHTARHEVGVHGRD